MNKMVPKVMINMNEYIPSGILGKRVKLDFSKDHIATMSGNVESVGDYGLSGLPTALCTGIYATDPGNVTRTLASGVINSVVFHDNNFFFEMNNLEDTSGQTGFALAAPDTSDNYYYLYVTLDQLAQNGGVSWYSKPLASVREAVAA